MVILAPMTEIGSASASARGFSPGFGMLAFVFHEFLAFHLAVIRLASGTLG
jgi:hypothetical protein